MHSNTIFLMTRTCCSALNRRQCFLHQDCRFFSHADSLHMDSHSSSAPDDVTREGLPVWVIWERLFAPQKVDLDPRSSWPLELLTQTVCLARLEIRVAAFHCFLDLLSFLSVELVHRPFLPPTVHVFQTCHSSRGIKCLNNCTSLLNLCILGGFVL